MSDASSPDNAPFDEAAFEAAFDAAVARCEQLTRADARQFLEKGYVVIKSVLSKSHVDAVLAQAWADLRENHGIEKANPASWDEPSGAGIRGYVRTKGSGQKFNLKADVPLAFKSQTDVIGGVERLPNRGDTLAWGDEAIGNLGIVDDGPWQPPAPQQHGWHKDGWHFRHFLGSKEQGLLTVPIFSDILPNSGGTFIATDSIAPVARLLAAHPEGLHPDSVQGGGYLIPGLVEQCVQFEELTGNAGDMALLHPYMLHRVSPNPTNRPRFIANMSLVLTEPMQFDRDDGEYSLVELTVLRALKLNQLNYQPERPMQGFVPGPFRSDEERSSQALALQQEMLEMANCGTITPAWGPGKGYGSNRSAAGDPPK